MQKYITLYDLLSSPWMSIDPDNLTLLVDAFEFNCNILDNIAQKTSKRTGIKKDDLMAMWVDNERKTHHILQLIMDTEVFGLCYMNGRFYYLGDLDVLGSYLEDIQIETFYPEEMTAVIRADSMYGIPEIDIKFV